MADRKADRRYDRAELNESRRYNELQQKRALMYNARQLKESREYNRRELAESRAYSRGELGRLVQDAQKAGFNPLTVLRNGGGAGYSAGAGFSPLASGSLTSSSLTSGALSATPLSRQAPVEQAVGGSPVGDAISQFGRDFMSSFDPFADDKREQEYRLVESQIASYNAGALSMSAPPAVQSYGSPDVEVRPSGSSGALSKPAKWEAGDVSVTNPWKNAEVDPGIADVETFQTRYGDDEIKTFLYGSYVAANDAWRNVKSHFKQNWKVSPLSEPVKKQVEESWLPSWVPRFDFKWN